MAYTSVGEAAARGLERGIRVGTGLREQERLESERKRIDAERAEDRQFTLEERAHARERRAVTEARADEDAAYNENKRALEAVEVQAKDLGGRYSALLQQYGSEEAIPQKDRDALESQWTSISQQRRAARARLYAPIMEKQRKESETIMTGLANGTLDLAKVGPARFYLAVQAATGMDPADFLRDENGTSRVGGAIQDVHRGLDSGDRDSLVRGSNVLMSPSLRVGVGYDGPQGTVITGKEIVDFVPGPNGQYIPAMKVTVESPYGRQMTKNSYIAPPTEGRGTNGDARVTGVDMEKALDRLGRIGVLEQTLNSPEVRQLLVQGARELGPRAGDYLDGLRALPESKAGKFTVHDVQAGGHILQQTRNERGGVVKTERIEKSASPDAVVRAKATGIRTAQGKNVVEEIEEDDPENPGQTRIRRYYTRVTPDGKSTPVTDKDTGERVAAPTRTPTPRAETPKEKQAKALTDYAGGRGWIENRDAMGGYLQADGRPLTQTQQTELAKAKAAISRGERPAKATEVDAAAERALAKQAIKDGADEAAVKKMFKERTGQTL